MEDNYPTDFAPAQIITGDKIQALEQLQLLAETPWNRMKKDQREQYQLLKEELGFFDMDTQKKLKAAIQEQLLAETGSKEEEIHEGAELPEDPEPAKVPPLTDEAQEKRDLLQQCFGGIDDPDDKGLFQGLLADDHLISNCTKDQIFEKAFWMVQDGGSRGVLRRVFGKQ